MNKILIISTKSSTIINFRKTLIETLINRGYFVSVICNDEEYKNNILSLGVEFYKANFNNRSINFFKFNKIINSFRKIISDIKPDIVFTCQLYPNLFGTLASFKENVKKIYSMNEGLGDGFGNNHSLKGRIIKKISCLMHKKSFKCINGLVVLNSDDADFFVKNNIISKNKIHIVNGVGVDIEKFEFAPLPASFSVLNVSRLVKTKGIFDFCEIASLVKKECPTIEFHLVGPEGDITQKDIQQFIKSSTIIYHGPTNNVVSYIHKSSLVVLPSYREGFSIALLEGAACGRTCIAYNVPGPNSFIIDGKNGFLIPFGDKKLFAETIIELYKNCEKLKELSKSSYDIAVNEFNSKKKAEELLNIILND